MLGYGGPEAVFSAGDDIVNTSSPKMRMTFSRKSDKKNPCF
jgi:hypothetical protein